MGINFIDRTIRVSWIVGAILFVFLTPLSPVSITWGVGAGVFLSGMNLWILQGLFGSFFLSGFSKKKMIAYLGMKFPLFYGLLILVVTRTPVSFEAFSIGFILPFVVMVLKSLGQLISAERSSFSTIHREQSWLQKR